MHAVKGCSFCVIRMCATCRHQPGWGGGHGGGPQERARCEPCALGLVGAEGQGLHRPHHRHLAGTLTLTHGASQLWERAAAVVRA